MKPAEYHRQSRDLTLSFFFVAPLLAFYELGSLTLDVQVRNGADVLLRNLFGIVGQTGVTIFNVALLAVSVGAGIKVLRRDRPVFGLLPVVLAESCLYAIFFAPTVLLFESRILPYLVAWGGADGWYTHAVLSAGAGVYEELLFRLLVAGSCFLLMMRVFRFKKGVSALCSVVFSAVLFSGFHHIGAYGEPFEMHAFLFRLIAGILLSAIFLTRGLAVSVYTHAFYDMLVFLQRQGSAGGGGAT